MKRELISIIIPVFNAEKTINKCLNSVLIQSYSSIEIILIDDGSSDDSGKICDDYASKDNRIKVIHQSNQGVSVARQTGLDNATGEYVIHVDADDWIEPTAIEVLYKKAAETQADMVISDYWLEDDKGPHYISQELGECSADNVLMKLIRQELYGCCWNKLIKRPCIQKYNIQFKPSNISFCEDLLFNSRLLKHNIRVAHLSKAVYHYFFANQNNLSNSRSKKRLLSRMYVNDELEKMLDNEKKKDMFSLKKDVLFEAFLLKQFSYFKHLYPDVQSLIIKNTGKFRFYTPISSCLSLAFRGYPYFAFYLYKALTLLIHLRQSFNPQKQL